MFVALASNKLPLVVAVTDVPDVPDAGLSVRVDASVKVVVAVRPDASLAVTV
jgi:hypothetical protein